MANLNPRWLIGRKIVKVEMQPFQARPNEGRLSPVAHDPVIWLDNGAHLTFTTEETECGVYGTSISYHKGKL